MLVSALPNAVRLFALARRTRARAGVFPIRPNGVLFLPTRLQTEQKTLMNALIDKEKELEDADFVGDSAEAEKKEEVGCLCMYVCMYVCINMLRSVRASVRATSEWLVGTCMPLIRLCTTQPTMWWLILLAGNGEDFGRGY